MKKNLVKSSPNRLDTAKEVVQKNYEIKWFDWTPWLFDDTMTIEQVRATIPSDPDIHWIVWLFENPRSPLHLPGPTDLDVHDTLHILFGRGLKNQDEAFVIGLGMGASTHTDNTKRLIFEFVGTKLYPKPYKFTLQDMAAFHIAFDFGLRKQRQFENIHLMDYREIRNMSVKELRAHWGITPNLLNRLYNLEREQIPDSKVTKRLPVWDNQKEQWTFPNMPEQPAASQ